MFSCESSSIRHSLAVAVLFSALIILAPGAVGQDSSNHASGPQSPSELRVFDSSLIDKSIDPCENFYLYSCNGWFKRNPLPPDQTSYGRFTELAELNRLHLKQILEAAADAQADARSANGQKIGDEYASCMDIAAINKLGIAPLQPELDRIAALKSVSDLPAELAHLHQIGVNAFFGMGSNQDFADASQVISFYGAGGPRPSRARLLYAHRCQVRRAAEAVRRSCAQDVCRWPAKPDAQAAKDADTVLALETRLAKASLTVTEQRDPQNLNHPTDVASFEKELPHFKLADYVSVLQAPAAGKMNDTEPKFFAEFNAILADTPLDKIKTYLRWHLLHAYAGTSMPDAFDQENWNFYAHIAEWRRKAAGALETLHLRIDHEMGEALGQVYVEKYFPPEEKARALNMTCVDRAGHGHGYRFARLDERRKRRSKPRKSCTP